MERCPFCGSEDIYFSKKRKIFVCEDCDKSFAAGQLPDIGKEEKAAAGLDLFFSYGHDKNSFLVERIKADLEKRGHRVWIDSNEIKTGAHWRDDILNGVLNASRIIAFLSEHSTRDPGVCLDELKIAVCVKGADIKTVLMEPEHRIKPPATLSDIQWLDMSEWPEIRRSAKSDFEQWYQEKFAELCQVLESDEARELSGDIQLLKSRLSPYLNSEKEYKLLGKEYFGRRWLESYLADWLENRPTKAMIIYGRPGSGKSTFSVNYSHYNTDVYGCFLCEWNRDYTTDPKQLIRTIAFRLATKLQDYRSILLHQLADEPRLTEMDAEALFDFLLADPLAQLVDGERDTGIILVDGLDEAENGGDNPLARIFARCAEGLPRWLRFVFTSRPEKNVSKYFQACESIDIIADMPDGYNDIMGFLLKSLKDELGQTTNRLEVLRQISGLSDGIFLYAELLVADIKNGQTDLSDLDSLPKGLNEIYRMSMERKFASRESFLAVRDVLELLASGEAIPEELVERVYGSTRYAYLSCLDQLGSWVNRYTENGLDLIGFSHKSVKDWLTDKEQSSDFYVDDRTGALRLARFCREYLAKAPGPGAAGPLEERLFDYIKNHLTGYYLAARQYQELEEFLLANRSDLDPYWHAWRQFPPGWNNSALLAGFWTAAKRNNFLQKLQREGNASFLLWIFELAEADYGIQDLSKELLLIYMDIVHIGGEYARAVAIADQYLDGRAAKIGLDEFLTMLSVRRLHHGMFFKPVRRLIEDALALFARLDDRFPLVYNELLFLIGGNLGLLYGDREFCKKWLDKSIAFAQKHDLPDFNKRNARKEAEYYCLTKDYARAEQLLREYIPDQGRIKGRYEAYLLAALANICTCIDKDDEALKHYEQVLKYTAAKGIPGWTGHANLGIANINYKLGNLKEAGDFASRAREIYSKIHQEWGLIMSDALLAACASKMGIAPLRVACDPALKQARRMQYGSCLESLEELCDGANDFLKLYFL